MCKSCENKQVVYKLTKLAMILLSWATTSVERVFSVMKYVTSQISNKMGDQCLNDCLVTYMENDILRKISNDVILAHF